MRQEKQNEVRETRSNQKKQPVRETISSLPNGRVRSASNLVNRRSNCAKYK